jgi:cytochrome c5
MPPRVLSASEAADALARQDDWDRVNRWPEHASHNAEAEVPPEVAKEGRRRREWRKRMRESRDMLERAPLTAEGYDEMQRRGGTIGRDDAGKIVVSFPEGGMRTD